MSTKESACYEKEALWLLPELETSGEIQEFIEKILRPVIELGQKIGIGTDDEIYN